MPVAKSELGSPTPPQLSSPLCCPCTVQSGPSVLEGTDLSPGSFQVSGSPPGHPGGSSGPKGGGSALSLEWAAQGSCLPACLSLTDQGPYSRDPPSESSLVFPREASPYSTPQPLLLLPSPPLSPPAARVLVVLLAYILLMGPSCSKRSQNPQPGPQDPPLGSSLLAAPCRFPSFCQP